MKLQELKPRLVPHAIAMAAIIILLAIYFFPAFFQSKSLKPNDVLQGMGAAQEAVEFRKATGEEALWTNSMFGGMPIYILNVHYSGDLITPIKTMLRFLPAPADLVFLNFVCFYILLLAFRCRSAVAFIGAFAYSFTSYNFVSIEAGHIFKSLSMAFIPLMFAGIIFAYRGKYILGMALASFALSCELNSQHYQIAYYFGFLVIAFGISELIFALLEKRLPQFMIASGVLLIALAIGIGTNVGRIWSTAEYTAHSIRGKSELAPKPGQAVSSGLDRTYAFQWSQGKMETFTLLVPYFYGGSSTERLTGKSETAKVLKQNGYPSDKIPLYWGDQPFTSGPVYAGAIVLFLFVLGLLILENKIKWWLLAGVIISIVLSWGRNFEEFNYFMFDYFPAYNKFRAVSMALVVALFCFPLMAALTIERLINTEDKEFLTKSILRAAGVVGGLCLAMVIFAGMADFTTDAEAEMPEVFLSALKADREYYLRMDAFRSLILIVLGAGLLYLFVRSKLALQYALGGVLALCVFDFWMVDKRYLATKDFSKNKIEKEFTASAADEMILKDKSLDYRVLNLTRGNPYTDAHNSYFHKSVGGYHGFKIRRYNDIIDKYLLKEKMQDMNMQVLNMLNTKYFIMGDPNNPVSQNPGALGNAWFVNKIKPVKSPDEELNGLEKFNAASEALVDVTKFKVAADTFPAGGTIRLTAYKPNDLIYETNNPNPGFAVFSEIYYTEGWTAYLDGKPAPILRANYILRAMEIPAGQHKVEFKFAPDSYFVGNKIMMISSVLLLVTLVVGIGIVLRKEMGEKQE
ncbi:MAG: YfhO family protein [Cytophagaceae bacterium]